jgi:3D (Asp-Asp-Asp) domain-containing protein
LSDIKVLVDQKGGYNITVNDHVWLRSSHTALYVDNKWYSSDDNSLPLTSTAYAQGHDPNLGTWNETQLIYDLVHNETHTKIIGHIRQWSLASAITFHLDTGGQIMTNTVPLTMDQVRTVFPSFHIEEMDMNDHRGYFTVSGKIDLRSSFKISYFLLQGKCPVTMISMQVVGIHQAKSFTRAYKVVPLFYSISPNEEKVIY